MMGKVSVTLPDGRVVDGTITYRQPTYHEPVLIAEGKSYSGRDAVNQGLCIHPIDDPDIDRWLNTLTPGG